MSVFSELNNNSSEYDVNPYLIGFNNGVYDLMTGEFREGHIDDSISLSTRINKINFSTEHPHWNDLNNFICSIFPNEEQREYFMTYLSTCLQGINVEQKFRVWVGDGANGKSKLEELFIKSFGDYAFKLPITLLTGKRNDFNQITPELVRAKGRRFVYFAEPEEYQSINSGILKEFVTNNKVYMSGENGNVIEFTPQYKMALICNNVPKFSEDVMNHLEIIKFTSKFVENPNSENPNEFHRMNNISEKIELWKEFFMSYLIDVQYKCYRESAGKSLIVPDEVKKFTKERNEI